MKSLRLETKIGEVDSSIDDDTLFRSLTWRIMPVLMFAYITAYIDRINVGFAKLHMASDLGFSNAVFGFGAGIFFLGYVLFEVPSNMALTRFGARLWFVRIMLSWSLISGLTFMVTTPMQFYVMRFLLGVAEAGFIPGLIYYIGQFFPADRRGRVMSFFYTGLAMAGLIGGPLSGFILHSMNGVHGLAGWKWMFIIEALPAGLAAYLVWKVMPTNPTEAKFLTVSQRARLKNLLHQDKGETQQMSSSEVWTNPYIWLMSAIYFANILAIYGIGFWTPTLLKNMGAQNDLTIGLLSAIPNACAVLTMVYFGRSADKHRERRWHLVLLLAFSMTGLAMSIQFQNQLLMGTIALCIATIGLLSFPPLFWSLPTAILGAGQAAAVGIALVSSVGNVAGFAGPYLLGYVKDATGSTDMAVYLLIGTLLLGAIMTLAIPKRMVNR